MTAQIIPFRHPYPVTTRLNTGFVVTIGLSIAFMILMAGEIVAACL